MNQFTVPAVLIAAIKFVKEWKGPMEAIETLQKYIETESVKLVSDTVLGINLHETLRKYLDDNYHNREVVSKLPMIKYCRTISGWGLKEAKDYVEANYLYRTFPTTSTF